MYMPKTDIFVKSASSKLLIYLRCLDYSVQNKPVCFPFIINNLKTRFDKNLKPSTIFKPVILPKVKS